MPIKDKLFDELLGSIQEGGTILTKRKSPSRIFIFDKHGWITISWIEDDQLCHRKFDTVSAAKLFYRELKKKGLK